jgi:hypothetical protein
MRPDEVVVERGRRRRRHIYCPAKEQRALESEPLLVQRLGDGAFVWIRVSG